MQGLFSVRAALALLRRSSTTSNTLVTPLIAAGQVRCAQTLKHIERHGDAPKTKLLRDNFPQLALEVDVDAINSSSSSSSSSSSGVAVLERLNHDSGQRVPWKCGVCAFSWSASIVSRTVLRKGCPACHRRDNPILKTTDPKIHQEWHQTRNDPFLDPNTVEVTHPKRVWWQCGSCHAEFEAKVGDRIKGKAPCPECDRGQFSDFRVSKALVAEFHPAKNGDLTLAKLRPTDRVKVWWLCHSCGYEWQCAVALRSGGGKNTKHTSCPKCFEKKMATKTKHVKKLWETSKTPRNEGKGGMAAAAS